MSVCGEDEFGIWTAGSIIPGVTPEQVAALRRSPLSGDWRRIRGKMELIRALAVNSPGFPVLRSVGNRPQALVAAGIVSPLEVNVDVQATPLTVPDDPPSRSDLMGEVVGFDVQEMARDIHQRIRDDAARQERLATLLAVDQMERGERLGRLGELND